MTIRTRTIDYHHEDCLLQAEMAWDARESGPRPGVLIAHTWAGRGDAESARARQLAELGYAGFALDLFGKGVRGRNLDENRALIRPLMDDRELLQRRMARALETLAGQPEVDAGRCAAIGYCFGGLCVLDLARSGAELAGVVSFHGLLAPPGSAKGNRIGTRVLVLHGWDDPMAPPEDVVALGRELSEMEADWQIHAYGHTMHAFTNPGANNPDFGTVYQPRADRRSWQAMRNFLEEVLS